MPLEEGLPKLRMRGKSINDAYRWFLSLDINADKYKADFVPHPPDYSWATIFIVNKNGIQGEIIFGGHHQLTQGFHDNNGPMIFKYDFKRWQIAPNNKDALSHLRKIAQMIKVASKSKQKELKNVLGATFVNDYIEGYFETTDSSMGTWYIDYSPSLGKMYADIKVRIPSATNIAKLSGLTGCLGTAKGKIRIVHHDKLENPFPKGSILVCKVTTPNYVPLMRKAAAIVTD
jgi:hypothetical protein